MRLSKIDLSNIVAVGHSDGYLGLLIDRGEEIELYRNSRSKRCIPRTATSELSSSIRKRGSTSQSKTTCDAASQLIDGESSGIRSHQSNFASRI